MDLMPVRSLCFLLFEKGSQRYLAEAGCELMLILTQPFEQWDSSATPLHFPLKAFLVTCFLLNPFYGQKMVFSINEIMA